MGERRICVVYKSLRSGSMTLLLSVLIKKYASSLFEPSFGKKELLFLLSTNIIWTVLRDNGMRMRLLSL